MLVSGIVMPGVVKSTELKVLWPHGVLWNDIEGQFDHRRQSLAGVLLHVPARVFLLQSPDLLCQGSRNTGCAKTVQPWMTRGAGGVGLH